MLQLRACASGVRLSLRRAPLSFRGFSIAFHRERSASSHLAVGPARGLEPFGLSGSSGGLLASWDGPCDSPAFVNFILLSHTRRTTDAVRGR